MQQTNGAIDKSLSEVVQEMAKKNNLTAIITSNPSGDTIALKLLRINNASRQVIHSV